MTRGLAQRFRGWVFDLDDTLYLERSYNLSGFRAVARRIQKDHGIDVEAHLTSLFDQGHRQGLFDSALRHARISVTPEYVAKLVETYRGHSPEISVFDDAGALIEALGARPNIRLGLVSDGYRIAQESKFHALQLAPHFHAVIFTDALGGREFWKPSPKGFAACLELMGVSASEALYVADNPLKDFLGARRAGLYCIRIRRPGTEHAELEPADASFAADQEFRSLLELRRAL